MSLIVICHEVSSVRLSEETILKERLIQLITQHSNTTDEGMIQVHKIVMRKCGTATASELSTSTTRCKEINVNY